MPWMRPMQRIMNKIKIIFLAAAMALDTVAMTAESNVMRLDLRTAIQIAADSSLTAFRARNLYRAGYWQYRMFRAQRLPSLSLDVTPARYYREITSRYDYDNNIDVYRPQQSYSASARLKVSQNFDLLGGTFFAETDIDYMRNIGDNSFSQFQSVPFRIGYSQQLLGYNSFRWDKKIEPLKYEAAKKDFLYNLESLSETVVDYYFALVMARTEYRLAQEALASADTLYTLGERRFRIAAISQADLLTLKLDLVNARNSLENSRIALKSANASLASFIGLDQTVEIETETPPMPGFCSVTEADAIAMARQNSPNVLNRRTEVLEAKREVNKTRMENIFSASVNASIGYNQVGNSLPAAYRHLLRQDLVSVSLTIPLVDWGVRKGKYNMAVSNLDVALTAERQEMQKLEEEVAQTVDNFNIQLQLVRSAAEAMDLADTAFAQTQMRFMIGKADMNSLTLASQRRQDANKNYITSLKNYWSGYFKLRRLTLYDFERGIPLARAFDVENNVR